MKNRYTDIQFGDITISGNRPYLIAEAGVNYENSMEEALKMVEEAANAGADAIKFQSYKAGKIASVYSPSYWDLSKESTTSQHELFQKYDSFGKKEYETLAAKAKECGITFLSTPFDFDFADELIPLMPVVKIASADLTNLPFLKHCASKGKPIILSVGASNIGEVQQALETIYATGNKQVSLLHCVLSYPTAPENANLRIIEHLQAIFPGITIGYSDHVPPHHDCIALTTAWLLGARILEKHFTLDKTKPGNDHYHAMDPEDIRNFRKQCDFVTSTLGQYNKEVLPCEQEARKQARRSLVITSDKKAGDSINENDLMIKRPGTGIAPEHIDLIVGKKIIRNIREDELLQWDMFLGS
jgi:sialic acid synthase SpsE